MQFGNNAKIFRSSPTDSVNLEKDVYDNPVGERDQTGSPFFYYDLETRFEERALSSLLWDIYDNTPKEVTQTPVGNFKDDVSISLINLIRIITVNKVTSTQQLYDSLQRDSVISRPQKNEINGIFASFGICKDLNKDLWCNRGETILSHGFTSWTALYEFDDFLGHHHRIFFTYPYSGTNNPNGRP